MAPASLPPFVCYLFLLLHVFWRLCKINCSLCYTLATHIDLFLVTSYCYQIANTCTTYSPQVKTFQLAAFFSFIQGQFAISTYLLQIIIPFSSNQQRLPMRTLIIGKEHCLSLCSIHNQWHRKVQTFLHKNYCTAYLIIKGRKKK